MKRQDMSNTLGSSSSSSSPVLYFVSSNENKFLEIQKLLDTEKKMQIDNKNRLFAKEKEIEIYFKKLLLKEIQSESIIEVAEDKTKK